VFVSDTEAGKVFAYDPNGWREIKAPKGVNGITFFKDRMFAVSWDLHEVYELDAAGKDEPKPFGLAGHFKALDGIEVLDDGTFIVSDFDGGKVCTISPDRKKVDTLLTCESPADIGLDRARGLLYVPQFLKNRVLVFQLAKLKK
jgi:sugar lactone lactonase YvrE